MMRISAALEKVGFLLGLDINYLFRNSFFVSIRFFFISVTGLLLSVAFARLLPPEAYGKYQFALSALAFASVLSLPGMNLAAMKAAVGGQFGGIVSATRLCFRMSLLAVPILLVLSGYFAANSDRDMAVALALLAPIFPFLYAFNTWYVYYESQGDFRSVAWRSILLSGLPALLVVGMMTRTQEAALLLLAFAGSSAALNVIFYIGIRRRVLTSGPEGSKVIDTAYGKDVTLQKFVLSLGEVVPPLVVGVLYGYREVAIFQIAYFSVNAFSGYIGAVSAIYIPKLFSSLRLQHGKIFLGTVLAGVAGAVGVAIFLFALFPSLYGEAFSESLRLAWWLVPLVLLLPGKAYLIHFFTTAGDNYRVVGIYVFANVASLAFFAFEGEEDAFVRTSVLYLYLLNALIVFPMFFIYWRKAIAGTRSASGRSLP